MSLFHLAVDLCFLFPVLLGKSSPFFHQQVEKSGIGVKKNFVTNIQVVFIRRAQDVKNRPRRDIENIDCSATAPHLMHLSCRFAVIGQVVHIVLLTLQFFRKGETKPSAQSWVRN